MENKELESEIIQKRKLLQILEGYSFGVTVYVMAYLGMLCFMGLYIFIWLSMLFWFASFQNGELKFEFLEYGFWLSLAINTVAFWKINYVELDKFIRKILKFETHN